MKRQLMRLRRISDEWVIALLLLGFTEISAVHQFLVKRELRPFLVLSALVALLAGTMLWIRPIVRHGVTNFQICIVIGIGCGAGILWGKGYLAFAVAIGTCALIGAVIIVRKLLRPVDPTQQEAFVKAYKEEANSAHPAVRDFLSFAMFTTLGVVFWMQVGRPITPGVLILFPLPIWYLWRTIFHIWIRPDDGTDHISTEHSS
jgi:hypothetical protein